MAKANVDDIVTCNRNGYWEVIAIKTVSNRWGSHEEYELELVMGGGGKIPKNTRKHKSRWVELFSLEKFQKQRAKDMEKWDNLETILCPKPEPEENSEEETEETLENRIAVVPETIKSWLDSFGPPDSLWEKKK